MDIEKMIVEMVAEKLLSGNTEQDTPFEVGKCYFIRTCSYHWTGRVTAIRGRFLLLADAAWIADSGRFHEAITTGELGEVEPVTDVIVNIDSITDALLWVHDLPRTQK